MVCGYNSVFELRALGQWAGARQPNDSIILREYMHLAAVRYHAPSVKAAWLMPTLVN